MLRHGPQAMGMEGYVSDRRPGGAPVKAGQMAQT